MADKVEQKVALKPKSSLELQQDYVARQKAQKAKAQK